MGIIGTDNFRHEHRLNSCVHVIRINRLLIAYIANKAHGFVQNVSESSCKPLSMIGHVPLMMYDVFDSCGS